MLSKDELEMYDRQMMLVDIGVAGQKKIKKSKVLVIGAGGLGCPVLRYLAASGIGNIGIVDFDTVSVSNLHRQILYDFSDEGKKKAITAKLKLEKINPFINIYAFSERLTTDNSVSIFKEFEIIVDCTDNYETRFLINDTCVLLNKPFVYGSIYKFEGQISVFNWKNGPTYRCLFKDFPSDESINDCNSSGVLGVLPGMIGVYQANEVLKMVLEIGDVLSGKLFILNGLTNKISQFKILKSKEDLYPPLFMNKILNDENYFKTCRLDDLNFEIDLNELVEKYLKDKIQLIDVRNLFEQPLIENDKIINIPFSEIEKRVSEIQTNIEVVLFCKSGIRSFNGVKILKENHGIKNVKSLKGGITDELLEILSCDKR